MTLAMTPGRWAILVCLLVSAWWPGICTAASANTTVETTQEVEQEGLPYVYTRWRQFTVEDGLPNDHVFAVKVQGSKVWVGTENGLACLDKQTGAIRTWTEADGLPWRVVSCLDVDEATGCIDDTHPPAEGGC